MSAMVITPISKTDPYTPEKSEQKPVRLKLIFADGRVVHKQDGRRVLTTPPLPLGLDGAVLLYRATEGDGTRVYRELPVLNLDAPETLSIMQAEYVKLSEQIANPKWEVAFHGDRASIEHGKAVVRRQAIAFHLVDVEIKRILKS